MKDAGVYAGAASCANVLVRVDDAALVPFQSAERADRDGGAYVALMTEDGVVETVLVLFDHSYSG